MTSYQGETSSGSAMYPGTVRHEVVPIRYMKRPRQQYDDEPPRKQKQPRTATPAVAHPPPPAPVGPPRARNGDWYTTTRRGTGICEGYQTGTCTQHGLNRICTRDGVSVHVCAICRRYGHGAQFPRCLTKHPEAPAAAAGAPPGGAGAGRGAGNGRGRGRARAGKGRGKNGK